MGTMASGPWGSISLIISLNHLIATNDIRVNRDEASWSLISGQVTIFTIWHQGYSGISFACFACFACFLLRKNSTVASNLYPVCNISSEASSMFSSFVECLSALKTQVFCVVALTHVLQYKGASVSISESCFPPGKSYPSLFCWHSRPKNKFLLEFFHHPHVYLYIWLGHPNQRGLDPCKVRDSAVPHVRGSWEHSHHTFLPGHSFLEIFDFFIFKMAKMKSDFLEVQRHCLLEIESRELPPKRVKHCACRCLDWKGIDQ